jgi:gluconolactonase
MLLFSDIPANRIYVYDGQSRLEVYREQSNGANGNAIDRTGRLITCEQSTRRVTVTDVAGRIAIVCDRYNGRRFNSPNDLVVKSTREIYFTDPPYGVQAGDRELDFCGVFRVGKDGRVTLLTSGMTRPNGIAFSPDERRLYVSDSSTHEIRVFDVKSDGTLANSRVFAKTNLGKPGVPDGMKVDSRGNVYATASGGVQVFNAAGARLGVIAVPEVPANIAWGGADRRTLFITARKGLYKVSLGISGR